ncbi:N-acetylmuramoyl-L-alanine amidase [Stenotrophomonas maltophilia]|uniref:N-acetylmuramoyl-L-alanine amidase n=1 Tax=Stenotrophomonas maltophilia TaxID=40324 RepID=UPI000D0DEB37|nr:N-acetylmuramoyl-L-alanine amidase [Stenotrophomonas maltophilia]PSM15723.1 N-acetylmuramoyl-L-alanine amidase [Stenotrophomonas maltophilia]
MLGVAVVAILALAGMTGIESSSFRQGSVESDPVTDAIVTGASQDALDVYRRHGHLKGPQHAIAVFDVTTGMIRIDLRGGGLPEHGGAELEDLQQFVSNGALEALRPIVPAAGTIFFYNGKSFAEQYPEDAFDDRQVRRPRQGGGGLVVVSAGHGWYYHHRFRDWRAQRDPSNGIIEDEITPGYADELRRWMIERSQVAAVRIRSEAADFHTPSGYAWWRMAARYSLEASHPEQPDLWNSLPTSDHALRERDEDIRSRPRYANLLQAEALFHLHTNAGPPAASGARAYVAEGRPEEHRLASQVLCYMKELINSVDDYSDYAVASTPETGRHGENSQANMPSVIIEAGFHTNASDAAALLDPAFRTASMKGVEKGYRLFREGEGCVPLKVEPIQSIELSAGSSRRVDVVFEGHPRYPIDLVTTNVGCPPGWTCTDGKVHIAAPDEKPSQIIMKCENAGSAPLFWNTQVVDADGVKSPPVRHRVQCIRRPGGVSVAAAGLVGH